ncbi:MAG: hypothetical protein E7Z89_02075 [Cyanobacteria bacterium SIG28]|nr:hypothetical protein [Cyanobacteria bacterium SIG28]
MDITTTRTLAAEQIRLLNQLNHRKAESENEEETEQTSEENTTGNTAVDPEIIMKHQAAIANAYKIFVK